MKTTIKLFIVLVTALYIFTGCDKNEEVNGEVKTIQIAALLSETGGLSYLGLSSKAALEIAIDEINQDFQQKNYPYRFSLKVYDTQINPTLAVQAMQLIAASGGLLRRSQHPIWACRDLFFFSGYVSRYNSIKSSGFSVRSVRD